MEWTDILRCPKTAGRLTLDHSGKTVSVEHSDRTYPIVDGIIDFCPESNDRISAAYDKVAPRYDPYITASSVSMKILSRIIWGCADDRDVMDRVLV